MYVGLVIKRLGTGQRRHLARWLKQNYTSKGLNDLFTYLTKHPDATDDDIKRKFKKESWIKYLPVVKTNLYHAILTGLAFLSRNHHASVQREMLNTLIQLYSLYDLGIFDIVIKESRKLLEGAIRLGFHGIAMEALSLIIRSSFAAGNGSSLSLDQVKELFKLFDRLNKDIDVYWKNRFALIMLTNIYNNLTYKKGHEHESFDEALQLMVKPNGNSSFPSKYCHIRVLTLSEALSSKTNETTYPMILDLASSIENDTDVQSAYPLYSAYILHDASIHASYNNDFDIAKRLISQILPVADLSNSSAERKEIELYYFIAKLTYHSKSPDKAIDNVFISHASEFLDTIPSLDQNSIYIRRLLLKLLLINSFFEEARPHVDFFETHYHSEMKHGVSHIWATALIWASLYHYKFFDSEKLNSAIRKAEYRIKKLDLWTDDVKALVSTIKNLIYKDPSDKQMMELEEIINNSDNDFFDLQDAFAFLKKILN